MTSPLYVGTGLTEPAPLQCCNAGREVFRITPDCEIEQEGRRITDDDAAVADALRELILLQYKLVVIPAKRTLPYGKLKPLEWVLFRLGEKGVICQSAFGRYLVDIDRWWGPGCTSGVDCDSIEHGKALCWEDYQRRVAELFTKIGG